MTGINGLLALRIVGRATVMLFVNPMLYVVTVLLLIDLWRNVRVERKIFGVRITRIWKPYVFRQLRSIIVGLVASVLSLALGIQVHQMDIVGITGLTFLLGLVRMRWMATPFVLSIYVILVGGLQILGLLVIVPYAPIQQLGASIHVSSLLALAGVAWLAQAALLFWDRREGTAPALFASRRGKVVGAYKLQLGFIVPVVMWTHGGYHLPHAPLWWPPIDSFLPSAALSAMPLFLGVHAISTDLLANRPRKMVSRISILLAILTIVGSLVGHDIAAGYCLLFAVVTIVVWELVLGVLRYRELTEEPLCVPREIGVVVLYTIKNSLSERLGILPGEVITHVNSVPIHSEYDLHFAVDQNPAYARLQVLDRRGEIRLTGNPVYEGEKHQLGVIPLPQSTTVTGFKKIRIGFLQTLYGGSMNTSSVRPEEPETSTAF